MVILVGDGSNAQNAWTRPLATSLFAIQAAVREVQRAAEQAAIARTAATAARNRANSSQAAARNAQIAAKKAGASEADKALAIQLAQQAEIDAEKAIEKEAAAEVAEKYRTLKQSQLNDARAGRPANQPSANTLQTKAAYDAAARYDRSLNTTADGGSKPLKTAHNDTLSRQKAAEEAARAIAKTRGEPTNAQLIRMQKALDAWLDSIQRELRATGVDAWAHGRSPAAAINDKWHSIVQEVRNEGMFDPKKLEKAFAPTLEGLRRETPEQRKLLIELDSLQREGRKQLTDAVAALKHGGAKTDPTLPDKVQGLKNAYGYTDPRDPENDVIGIIPADFQKRYADLGEAHARDSYLQLLEHDPQRKSAKTQAAYADWQNAYDAKVLQYHVFAVAKAGAAAGESQKGRAALEEAKSDLAATQQDQQGIDIIHWLADEDHIREQLQSANAKVARLTQKALVTKTPKLRAELTAALQRQRIEQAKFDALTRMQALRDAQLNGVDTHGKPPDVAKLYSDVRGAVRKVNDLTTGPQQLPQTSQQLGEVDKLRNSTLPAEHAELAKLDQQIGALMTKKTLGAPTAAGPPLVLSQQGAENWMAGAAPPFLRNTSARTVSTDEPRLPALLNQRDYLQHRITLQESWLKRIDDQPDALIAQTLHGRSGPSMTGVDLYGPIHSRANDYALTWGITRDERGNIQLTGLPSNIKAEDVRVEHDASGWYVIFNKSSGVFAQPGLPPGISPPSSVFPSEIAIEKGHRYQLNPEAARIWQAYATDEANQTQYHQALAAVEQDPVTDSAGKPLLDAQGLPSTSQRRIGADGLPPPMVDFNVDQSQNLALIDRQVADAWRHSSPNLQLLLDKQRAVQDVFNWQQANFSRQTDEAQLRSGYELAPPLPPGNSRQRHADDLRVTAMDAIARWNTAQREHDRDLAKTGVGNKQAAYDEWVKAHPGQKTLADRLPVGIRLQEAKSRLALAEPDLTGSVLSSSDWDEKNLIAQNLSVNQRNDPRALYDLFMQNPKTMAQGTINRFYAQYGAQPVAIENRTQLRNLVALQLGFTPSIVLDPGNTPGNTHLMQTRSLFTDLAPDQRKMVSATVKRIVADGGEHARVTLLPVVYALNADQQDGGGIHQTVLFKVQDGDGTGPAMFVDEQGRHYHSIKDYRANNTLPADGVNLVMPEDGVFNLDEKGNVKLFAGDARKETGFQSFRRKTHLDLVVGGLGFLGGVLLEVGSAGTLTPVAGALMLGGASLYGAATSAQDLSNRATHGQSINPFTNREAGLDWLNFGASALSLPGLGSTTRITTQTLRAVRADTSLKEVGIVSRTGVIRDGAGAPVTDPARIRVQINDSGRLVQFTARPAQWIGNASMLDSDIEMVQNWRGMSNEDRADEGVMFLLGLGSFGVGPAATALKPFLKERAPISSAGEPPPASSLGSGSSPPPETGGDSGLAWTDGAGRPRDSAAPQDAPNGGARTPPLSPSELGNSPHAQRPPINDHTLAVADSPAPPAEVPPPEFWRLPLAATGSGGIFSQLPTNAVRLKSLDSERLEADLIQRGMSGKAAGEIANVLSRVHREASLKRQSALREKRLELINRRKTGAASPHTNATYPDVPAAFAGISLGTAPEGGAHVAIGLGSEPTGPGEINATPTEVQDQDRSVRPSPGTSDSPSAISGPPSGPSGPPPAISGPGGVPVPRDVFRLLVRADATTPADVPSIDVDGVRWVLKTFDEIPPPGSPSGYTAISYNWGEGRERHPFDPHADDIAARTIPVLEATIRSLNPKAVWVDALVLPQNSPEREVALGNMGAFYAHAEQTVAVLSPETAHALGDVRNTGRIAQDNLQKLANDPWVTRAWTYQELVNSNTMLFVAEGHMEPPIPAQTFLNALGHTLAQIKQSRGLDSFSLRADQQSPDRLEDALADWISSGLGSRFASQSMAGMDGRKAGKAEDLFAAQFGALRPGLVLNPPGPKVSPAEEFMKLSEERGDLSFIYSPALRRSVTPGKRWRPIGEAPSSSPDKAPIKPPLSWHTFGQGQQGAMTPTHLRLDNMWPVAHGRLTDSAEQFIGSWLNSGPNKSVTPDNVLDRLSAAGLETSGRPIELQGGYFFPEKDVADVSSYEVFVATGVRWVHGAAGLLVRPVPGKPNEYEFAGAGVFVGPVPPDGKSINVT